jgi:type VI secretion system secreted protein VgrG
MPSLWRFSGEIMPASLSQDNRSGKLTTPFGGDVLVLGHLNAAEGLSDLFEFHVAAVSLQANLDFNSALGLGSTVELKTPDGGTRYFNGLMTEAAWAGSSQDVYHYQLVLRPWLWFLTRTSDCRIFPNMNALDIIKQVFSDRGFTQFQDRTTSAPPKIEYCVQYRETDFNFVSRLMEEYGIYYYFTHSDGQHELVLADSKTSHDPAPGVSTLPYNPFAGAGRRQIQYIETWSRGRRAQTGKYTLNDYDYRKPPNDLKGESDKHGSYAHGSMEMYDYPGGYPNDTDAPMKKSDGELLAKFKVEAVQSLDERRSSSGIAPSLFPGALTTLHEIDQASENQEYLVTHCSHIITAQSYRSGQGGGGGQVYSGQYEMTPSSRQYRAPLVTHKPTIPGPQSALVVGQQGEEIDVDKLGRILVQFYWDRKKKPSRRVRVAQFWAGSQRGSLFLPRIGDEVMVAYEDGDPDRPIVVGSVYNGTNTVPMTLPDKKTKSGILTQSSKGGSGYHMLLFDDTAGSENVKLRSQKDLLVKALNDETRVIGKDQSEKIGGNLTQTVGGDKSVTVGGDSGGNYTMTAQQKIVLTVMGSSITIDPTGITLQAPMITLQADAAVTVTAATMDVTAMTNISTLNCEAFSSEAPPL